ncbi:RNA-binding protein 42 isoform X2 [Tribolium castaneum]|uniref:RNA-binding protein 42 n=1 Tax=Tribolium castaneum TaxID=7070 RepID=A0A139WIJ4_TRICA|nr:PREDICTED: RNA-binding protein 42 isoform X2 [Tribolium castaneum]KYB27828.1 RNA-binding protein 42-like Protein [Tribolium castaneum]|eukprot:XP_968207.1 PREDICTED: RNA-binding protein 42 isoform X2 [Tribolium castaneum]
MNSNKFRQMEDEMSRFEAEISGQTLMSNSYSSAYGLPNFGNIPPPPTPPLLIPHQVKKKANFDVYSSQPAVVSAKPTLYTSATKAAQAAAIAQGQAAAAAAAAASSTANQQQVDFIALQTEVEKKLKRLKGEKVSAELAISQGKASALQAFGYDDYRKKGNKNRKLMRVAGGQTWEDLSMNDWPDDDFRIFCGDLGNDVTDELLTRTFNKYPSFNRAKVIRDKRTNKSKGYGFISFSDPADFTKAMKEMNGRYVGSRPIKLRKSTWRNRCIDIVKKKEKEKATLIAMLTSGNGR